MSDDWLTSISSFSASRSQGDSSSNRSYPGDYDNMAVEEVPGVNEFRRIPSSPPLRVVSSFTNNAGGGTTSPMDLGRYDDDFDSSIINYQPPPFLPTPNVNELHEDTYEASNNNLMGDCCGGSFGSRSTSSFVSASDEIPPSSSFMTPLLPSVLPPPEFFSMKLSPNAPTSSLWQCQMKSPSNELVMSPLLPRKSSQSSNHSERVRLKSDSSPSGKSDEMSCDTSFRPATPNITNSATFTITLLDLRGSQRLSDRGLLHLSHTPLCSLEVARLDNCHGISGRGLLAFSRSYKLHTLSLSNCRRLTDEAVVNVSHLGASLMTLTLGGCRCLTDRSLEAMSSLLELRQLDLSQVGLVCDGLE